LRTGIDVFLVVCDKKLQKKIKNAFESIFEANFGALGGIT
jgi:hypothetical protein